MNKVKIQFIFKWYDLWIGFFYDKKKGIAHNGYGDAKHQRTCIRCGKVQNKVF